MEQRIRERFNENILHEIMRRFGIHPGSLRELDAFESFIFEFERGGEAFILRIAHSSRRSENLIAGEVDWINFLADGGVRAARAVCSQRGRLVETLDDGQGGQFLAVAFMKARGGPPWERWTPELYRHYGEVIGAMHARSTRYAPARPQWKRPEWDDPRNNYAEQFLPASEALALERHREAVRQVQALPKTQATYGMIHQDAHSSNFFVDEAGQITLFDFDDCVYSWFANDIAIVLFYMVADAPDPAAFTGEFLGHFLGGYREKYALDPAGMAAIPHFLKIREVDLYAAIHRDFDVDNINHEWLARYMLGRKQKIEGGVPFIDFDFERLAREL